jgi:hypothetical protein
LVRALLAPRVKNFRRDFGLGDKGPAAIPPGAEETAATPGVASDARLIDQQQHRIAVAIKAELAQQLNLPGGLTLSPELGARPRPIAGAALVEAGPHRIAVHPRQHQDFAGIVLLRDRRHETIGAKPDRGQRNFDLILHLPRPSAGCPCRNPRIRVALQQKQYRLRQG